MSELVNVTIDGVEVQVPKGTLIVEAAKRAGTEIPVFCYHSKLDPVGMCRMCLVTVGTPVRNRETGEFEVDDNGKQVIRFFPKPMTACTTPVSPGMVVITQSEESIADRRGILEFLLTSHPLDCPVCDKGGECSLQDLTYAYGPGVSQFYLEDKHHSPKKEPLGDLIYLDSERCILCARCVRFEDEIAGDPVLAIDNRGRNSKIVSYSNPKFDSKYSGNTTDICPVGALTTRDFRFGARAWELESTPSVCNLCGVGCNTVLNTRFDEIKRVMPRQNEALNEIWLCDKGRFGHHFNGSQNRLTTPLIKKNGQFEAASWDEALALVARKLELSKEKTGGVAGAHLSNEDLYIFQKLFRTVLGSNNIDHRIGLNANWDDQLAFEVGAGVGTDIGRLKSESAILVLGADLDEEAPVLYLRVRGSARRGAHLINAGGRWTKLDNIAEKSLRYRYGAESALAWGLVAAVLDEGLENKDFVAARVDGFEGLIDAMKSFTPTRAAEQSGVSEDDIRAAARTFAKAENGVVLYGLESGGNESLQAAIKTLLLITGHAGSANNGAIAVLPHANSRGAADMGIVPNRLPGYRPVEGEAGLSAHEMLSPDAPLPALYIVAADPAAQSARYKAAIEATEFVVVQDLFMTETAQLADVVLPARGTAERDGSFTSVERWVQAFDNAVSAPALAWADWLAFTALAGKMGASWSYASADGVMAEITQTVPLYAEMNFDNLTRPISLERKMSHYIYSGTSFTADTREGLQWRSVAEASEAKMPVAFIAPADVPPAEGMTLVAPRVLYDGGTLIAQAEVVSAHIQPAHAVISRKDAAQLGITADDSVTLTVPGASVTVPVRLNGLVPQGIVLVPRNLSGFPAEKLLGSKRLTAVKITKVPVAELA